MRVFVTGATGYIGKAIVHELFEAGHEVIGLARSDASASALEAVGAQVHRGELEDLESLQKGVMKADGVIHAGFIHEFSKYQANCELDRRVIEALGKALAGSDRPLVVTSGTVVGMKKPGVLAIEEDNFIASTSSVPRAATEEAAASVAAMGVKVSVLRLPPTVHGDGDQAFVPQLIRIAKEKDVSAFVNEGNNRWPAVHRLDAAHLYRLVLEKGTAGSKYHGVAEEGLPIRHIAEAIGRKLQVPIVSKTQDQAGEHFTWLSHFVMLDNPTSSERTRRELNWKPTRPGLIADLEEGKYFDQ